MKLDNLCSIRTLLAVSKSIIALGVLSCHEVKAIECASYEKQLEKVGECVDDNNSVQLKRSILQLCDSSEASNCDDGYLAQMLVDALALAINKNMVELEWFLDLQISNPQCFRRLLL